MGPERDFGAFRLRGSHISEIPDNIYYTYERPNRHTVLKADAKGPQESPNGRRRGEQEQESLRDQTQRERLAGASNNLGVDIQAHVFFIQPLDEVDSTPVTQETRSTLVSSPHAAA